MKIVQSRTKGFDSMWRVAVMSVVLMLTAVIAATSGATASAGPLSDIFAGSSGGQPSAPPPGSSFVDRSEFVIDFYNRRESTAPPYEITIKKYLNQTCVESFSVKDEGGKSVDKLVLKSGAPGFRVKFTVIKSRDFDCNFSSTTMEWEVNSVESDRRSSTAWVRTTLFRSNTELTWRQFGRYLLINRPQGGSGLEFFLS